MGGEMPTYDYVCQDCGYQFEVFHAINAQPVQKCPKCGGTVQKKISGGTGLLFRGSGFYITDYKNNKKEPASDKKELPKKETETEKTTKE